MLIHVLEDDPGVADALVVLIRQMGHEAVAYPDAEHFFRAKPPSGTDVLIVDLGLPGISGAQVLHWARELRDPPRVVAISGQSQSAIKAAIGEADMPLVMRKPLSEHALASLF
ncbi:MAG: response regulator [Hyphomicrobiales bacterium]|nr:response regulator [Hyphomicrobiales bacterium]